MCHSASFQGWTRTSCFNQQQNAALCLKGAHFTLLSTYWTIRAWRITRIIYVCIIHTCAWSCSQLSPSSSAISASAGHSDQSDSAPVEFKHRDAGLKMFAFWTHCACACTHTLQHATQHTLLEKVGNWYWPLWQCRKGWVGSAAGLGTVTRMHACAHTHTHTHSAWWRMS